MIFHRKLTKCGEGRRSRNIVIPRELLDHWETIYFQEITEVEIQIEGEQVTIRPRVPEELRRLISA